MAALSSMQEYLKRYTGGTDEAGREVGKKKQKKKRKKKRKNKGPGDAVRIVDDDAVWQKEIKEESEEEDEDDAPEVSIDIEARRLQRIEAIKAQRPYYSRSDDGSGWVAINAPAKIGPFAEDSSPPNKSNINGTETRSDSQDLSPPRKSVHDTPDSTRPRKSRHDTPNPSPRRRSQHDTHELSPPRKSRHDTHNLSPPKKSRHDIRGQPPLRETYHDTADLSPRKSQHESPDSSSPRKCRHESSNPPRQSQHDTPDPSPSRKSRHDTPDLSPPRKTHHIAPYLSSPKKTLDGGQGSSLGKQARQATPDLSPPRKHSRYHSPDRKSYPSRNLRQDTPDLRSQEVHIDSPELVPLGQAQQVAPDLSPPRKLRYNASPPRKPRHESPNLCPRRKGHGNTPDLSLSRNSSIHTPDLSPSRKPRFERVAERDKMLQNRDHSHRKDEIDPSVKARRRDMMMDGSSTGLCSGKEVVEGLSKKKEEDAKRISEMDPSITGRGADTIYRDKHGRRLESLELLKLQQADKKPKEKPLEWGKGLVQQREMEAIATAIEAEKDKPFARTRDDPELDKSLRERVRWGDPMAHLIKKKITEPVLEDFAKSEKLKESGFIVPQNIPNHSWLKRGITPPPNRYGIKPGRHWDGVDRSNGFEKQLFKQQNEKLALQQEAYLWSVSEM